MTQQKTKIALAEVTQLAQVTLLGENFKNLRGKITDVGL